MTSRPGMDRSSQLGRSKGRFVGAGGRDWPLSSLLPGKDGWLWVETLGWS